jgi:hypothetical protein
MKAKELVKIFSQLNPEEEVWATWITKENVIDRAVEFEMTDENDNLIDVKPLVDYLDVVGDVCNDIDNDDYLWERFGETYDDSVKGLLDELLKAKEEVKEDTDLWDIEMEKTND